MIAETGEVAIESRERVSPADSGLWGRHAWRALSPATVFEAGFKRANIKERG